MTKTSTIKQNTIAFLIPLVLSLTLVVLMKSNLFLANRTQLSAFITIDFIITIPIIYFLLIRKCTIPNFTIAPFLILCVTIASYTIPTANQDLLSLAKTWLIPFIELGILTFVILKVRNVVKRYKQTAYNHKDFYSVLVDTCESLFPKTVSHFVANEIALIYYGFFNYKKTALNANEFSNYKGSGILSTLVAFILVIGIEIITIHILAARWSPIIAWILTGLTAYSALQLIGIIRSVPKRPIVVNPNELVLRFGMLSETTIRFTEIESIEFASSSDFDKNKTTKTLSLLGELENSNIVIYLKSPQILNFIYGKPKTYTKLLLFVDDNQNFKTQVEGHLLN